MNRRSEILDKFIDELVIIRFTDGTISVGVLEFDMPHNDCAELGPSHEYSLYRFDAGRLFFKKSHVKGVEKWQEPILIP